MCFDWLIDRSKHMELWYMVRGGRQTWIHMSFEKENKQKINDKFKDIIIKC